MSQQVQYAEKNIAEGSVAMADEEEEGVVSITIPIIIIISVICTYFFHIFLENSPQYP